MKEKTFWTLMSIFSLVLNFMIIFILHEGTILILTIPMMCSFMYAAKTEK